MLVRILLMGILCVWCVIGEKMQPIVVSNHSVKSVKNKTQSNDVKIESTTQENTRQTRQLDPGVWAPFPAVWSPRPRSPLNTFWAQPWPFDNGHSLVRIHPPSPYWHDYHHHEEHEHHKHHEPIHPHKPLIQPFPGQPATYIAQNGGAIHIAPLPGHIGSVIASNMYSAPGTPPFFGPPFVPGISVDIVPPGVPGPVPPSPLPAPPVPPPIAPPLPPLFPRPLPPLPSLPPLPPVPVTRTW